MINNSFGNVYIYCNFLIIVLTFHRICLLHTYSDRLTRNQSESEIGMILCWWNTSILKSLCKITVYYSRHGILVGCRPIYRFNV